MFHVLTRIGSVTYQPSYPYSLVSYGGAILKVYWISSFPPKLYTRMRIPCPKKSTELPLLTPVLAVAGKDRVFSNGSRVLPERCSGTSKSHQKLGGAISHVYKCVLGCRCHAHELWPRWLPNTLGHGKSMHAWTLAMVTFSSPCRRRDGVGDNLVIDAYVVYLAVVGVIVHYRVSPNT